MFPKMDPKQMASLMKQMGIKNQDIPADRVVIEKTGGGKIVIENPQVLLVDMQGNKSFQISGEISEDSEEGEEKEKGESDAELVMRECACSRKEAEKALEESQGDLAQAILKLKGE